MTKVLKRICGAILLAAAGLYAGSAAAQAVNANLLGTIEDSSHASVPNATVNITETHSGVTKSMTSNSSGHYDFEAIQPGIYTVTAEQTGFKKAVTSNVVVNVNSTVRVDMTLDLGAATESVTVTAAAEELKTDRADTGIQLEAKQAEDLPLGTNRNFQGMLALLPGATKPHFQHSTFFNAAASLSTEVNGQSRLANNTEIEGIDDNERSGLLQVLIPPSEAIQSVSASTSNYQAEFGRAGGVVTDVILKSGTNNIHGGVYEFNRISALQAKNYFQTLPTARTVYNYTGANVGGPIIKDKLFLFGDYLHVSDIEGQFNTVSVPTAAFRIGDFSSVSTPVYDPATGNADGTGRTQFAYNGVLNTMDPARISPITKKILAMVPLPNIAGAGVTSNYAANTQYTRKADSFDVKADENLHGEDHLAYRYSWQRVNQYQQAIFGKAGGSANGGSNATGTQTAYNTAANYTHVLSPRTVAELRLGLNHYKNVTFPVDYRSTASQDIGIPGVNVDAFTSGLVAIDLGGGFGNPFVGTGGSYPWVRGETNIDAVNNWTLIRGNHSIKLGAEYRRVRDDLLQGQTYNPRGLFQYREGQTTLKVPTGVTAPKTGPANDIASFLLDVPNLVGRDIGVNSTSWRESQVFSYAQDTWQATQKLTLTLGLRWEFYIPPTPSKPGGWANYDPSTNNLLVAGVGSVPMDLGMPLRYRYVAPRLGVVYRLDDKTVVRGGYGISYMAYPDTVTNYAGNYPVKQNIGYTANSSFTQAVETNGTFASMAAGFPPAPLAVIPASGIITNAPKQSYNVVDLNWKAPYVESWNISLQHTLPMGFVLDTAYVGNVGIGQPQGYDLNSGFVLGAGAAGRPENATFGRTVGTRILKRSNSNYNSLQVKLERHFANGLGATTSYTWGKAMGFVSSNGSGVGGTNFYVDYWRNYSRLNNDRTNTFVQSVIYELPFGKGKKWANSGVSSWILGGWETTAVMTAESGLPFSVTASSTGLNAPNNTQVANINGPFRTPKGIGTAKAWFDPTVFSTPVGAVFGNTGQNQFVGPGYFNLDASVFRKFPITERVNLELRAEGFSVTNTPQFGNPSGNVSNSDFGHINGASGGATGNRTMELAAKVTF